MISGSRTCSCSGSCPGPFSFWFSFSFGFWFRLTVEPDSRRCELVDNALARTDVRRVPAGGALDLRPRVDAHARAQHRVGADPRVAPDLPAGEDERWGLQRGSGTDAGGWVDPQARPALFGPRGRAAACAEP